MSTEKQDAVDLGPNAGRKKIDPQNFTRTLTGFEEIAIASRFLAPLGDLQGGIIPRALLFIAEKRDGMTDADAFRKVMEMPLGDIETLFEEPDPEAEFVGKAQRKTGQGAGPTS